MKHTILTVLAAALLVLGAVTLGRDTPVQLADNAPPSEEISIHGYGDTNKTCQEWTDGCRTCSRAEDGAPMCPNIGMTCQPKAISCVRQSEAAK